MNLDITLSRYKISYRVTLTIVPGAFRTLLFESFSEIEAKMNKEFPNLSKCFAWNKLSTHLGEE